jgi:hypothetical protein
MMFHHDGLRNIAAENARTAHYHRATPSDPPLVFSLLIRVPDPVFSRSYLVLPLLHAI